MLCLCLMNNRARLSSLSKPQLQQRLLPSLQLKLLARKPHLLKTNKRTSPQSKHQQHLPAPLRDHALGQFQVSLQSKLRRQFLPFPRLFPKHLQVTRRRLKMLENLLQLLSLRLRSRREASPMLPTLSLRPRKQASQLRGRLHRAGRTSSRRRTLHLLLLIPTGPPRTRQLLTDTGRSRRLHYFLSPTRPTWARPFAPIRWIPWTRSLGSSLAA